MRESPKKSGVETEKNPESEEILGAWDKEILEKGVSNMVTQMVKDFDGSLPDAIVLPDTSARPLFYTLQPIFQKLHEARGLSVPRHYMFNSKRPELFSNDFEQKRMDRARDLMAERAKEIWNFEAKAESGMRIAIVDEYATADATTAKEIRRAFNDEKIRAYAVFAQESSAVQAGVEIDPHRNGHALNPRKGYKANMSYTGDYAVGVYKDKYPFKKYSSRMTHENPKVKMMLEKRKEQLRNEMRAIGEKIASTIEEQLNTQNDV
jgi:hypothetical protein